MRQVSQAFLDALTGSHLAVSRARVLTSYQDGPDPDGEPVRLIGGAIEGAAGAAVRHELEATVDGRGWDYSPAGLLTPYGRDLYVERGITTDGGVTVEWCPLGYYRLWDAVQEDAPDGPVELSGRDRMSGIVEARLEAPVSYPASTTVAGVFEDLIEAVFPLATIVFDEPAVADETLGRSMVVERKRYEPLRDLAAAYGQLFWVDELGRFRVGPPPAVARPVATVADSAEGVLVKLSREISRDGVYNAVVATGEGTDDQPPVRGVARDANPASPTYYYGQFGKVPRFYSSQYLKSRGQCRRAAREMLTSYLGLPHTVELEAAPNPALEPYDVIEVELADIGPRPHIIDESTIPLTADEPVELATRQHVDLQIEEE